MAELLSATPASAFARLRDVEFARLDAAGHTYLDFTGGGLYPASLIEAQRARLLGGVFGNPHSDSGASRRSTDAIKGARARVLAFFDADPSEYEVVFTSNASGAMRLVGSAFPWRAGSAFVLSADDHNSVNGIREYARRAGADVRYVGLSEELRPHDPRPALRPASEPSLFAFPAQSNFSGVQHPLELVAMAQARGYRVLLDAASYAPAHPLSLDAVGADFVALSFYKMFGYPTGLGALIARREAFAELEPRWFAGGTVDFVSVQNDMHRLSAGPAAVEEGTVDFLGIPAAAAGLDFLDAIGMRAIEAHVAALTAYALDRFATLRERVVVYGPRDAAARGGTIAFNLLDGRGGAVPHEL
ncbi:MAG TPA: aminotransferase class V-fold PLP-dependent enzyme, partial [Thermoanaerobaculia bacterium]